MEAPEFIRGVARMGLFNRRGFRKTPKTSGNTTKVYIKKRVLRGVNQNPQKYIANTFNS